MRLTIALAMLIAGCAPYMPTVPPEPLAVTADVAAIIVEEAVATNRTYVIQCAAGKISVAKCNEWSRFYTRFKDDARLAHAAFHRALAIKDEASAEVQREKFREWARQIAELAAYGGQ